MADQILWVNMLIALCGAVGLLVAPKSFCSFLGLPRPDLGFYPRLLGLTLLSISGAIAMEGYKRDGLGIEGMAAINLVGGAGLMLLLLFGGLVLAKRGRWLLRGLAVAWLVMGGLAFATA